VSAKINHVRAQVYFADTQRLFEEGEYARVIPMLLPIAFPDHQGGQQGTLPVQMTSRDGTPSDPELSKSARTAAWQLWDCRQRFSMFEMLLTSLEAQNESSTDMDSNQQPQPQLTTSMLSHDMETIRRQCVISMMDQILENWMSGADVFDGFEKVNLFVCKYSDTFFVT
jgi:hypothetical protein